MEPTPGPEPITGLVIISFVVLLAMLITLLILIFYRQRRDRLYRDYIRRRIKNFRQRFRRK